MRKAASFLFATVYMSAATIPAADSRNVTVPNTDTVFTPREYKTRAEWEARAAHLRRQILFSAGLMPMPPKTPLNAQVFGRIERRDYSVEKVLIETLPGYWLGGNLYQPVGKTGPFPAIVSPHGHWTYGRLENSANASIPARCINLARQGYIVFAYDMVGYNDTLQTPHAFGGRREQLWGFGPLGLQLWNSIRAVDFVESLADTDRAKDRRDRGVGRRDANHVTRGGGSAYPIFVAGEHDFVDHAGRVAVRKRCGAAGGHQQYGDRRAHGPAPDAHGRGDGRLDQEHAQGRASGGAIDLQIVGCRGESGDGPVRRAAQLQQR
jgi:hypothetical protein